MQTEWTTTILGFLIIGYGIFTLIARIKKHEYFSKLDKMKQALGEKKGFILHVIGYTLLPIIVGTILIISGLRGISVF